MNNFLLLSLCFVLAMNQLIKSEMTECKEPGWWYLNEHCYLHVQEKMTWHDAQKFCKQHNANLASIESKVEALHLARRNLQNVWIGLFRTDQENKWSWVDGNKKIEYLWDTDQPQTKFEGYDCVLAKNLEFWENTFCFNSESYMCEIRDSKPDCYQEMEFIASWGLNNHSYYLIDEPQQWHTAEQICSDCNANLVIFESRGEMEFLKHKVNRPLWIGLNRRTSSLEWKWVNGNNVTFSNWNKGQPVNLTFSENCVVAHYPDEWHDYPCTTLMSALCKKRARDAFDKYPVGNNSLIIGLSVAVPIIVVAALIIGYICYSRKAMTVIRRIRL